MNDFESLKAKVRKFNEERDWDQFHSPTNLAKSICIEAAELLECYQWNEDANQKAAEEELADVFLYCIQMADKLGVDLPEIGFQKLRKNAEKYPVERAKGKAEKYTKL